MKGPAITDRSNAPAPKPELRTFGVRRRRVVRCQPPPTGNEGQQITNTAPQADEEDGQRDRDDPEWKVVSFAHLDIG